jgi:hypothetical protein
MFARVKHILENFGQIVDINEIKEITKKKDKTKINLCLRKIMGFNDLHYIENYSKFYVYKNIYIIISYNQTYIYVKDSKYVIYYIQNNLFYYKYCRENNNNIKKLYMINELVIIQIFKYDKLKYRYDYDGKLKNDKYKSNYRLPYICFALPIELIFHIYIYNNI